MIGRIFPSHPIRTRLLALIIWNNRKRLIGHVDCRLSNQISCSTDIDSFSSYSNMEALYGLPFHVLAVPNLKLKKPGWLKAPSAMVVFAFVLLSYFLVTGGKNLLANWRATWSDFLDCLFGHCTQAESASLLRDTNRATYTGPKPHSLRYLGEQKIIIFENSIQIPCWLAPHSTLPSPRIRSAVSMILSRVYCIFPFFSAQVFGTKANSDIMNKPWYNQVYDDSDWAHFWSC